MTRWTPDARSRGDSKLVKLDATLAQLLKSTGLAARLESRPLFEAYRKAVGDGVAGRAKAVRFKDGILDVAVSSSSLLHDLRHFQAPRILEALRREVPSTPIAQIRFRLEAR